MRYSLRPLAFAVASLTVFFSRPVLAQDRVQSVVLDFPLVELPYNFKEGIRAPGLQQSLSLTSGFYELTHDALGRIAPRYPGWTKLGITLFDYFTIAVPFADAWLHEEWHRAILGHRGIGSRDEVWNLKNVFASSISVTRVADEDLIRLKRDHPADFVRMKGAGIEAEAELITRLERDQFFRQSPGWHTGLYWLVALNDQLYLGLVTSPEDSAEIDNLTDKANRDETTVMERDVSGHDFTAWVYHLFRPEEPFEARGPHPSGVGINRYIKVADLTADEKRFIAREGKLAWLNFLDPNFIGVHSMSFRNPLNGGDARGNLWMRHMLTSFGHTIDANFVFQQEDVRLHVVANRYTNHDRSFPGMRAELVELPVRLGSQRFALSPRLAAWSQPRAQKFKTRDGALGGLAGLRVATEGQSRMQFYADAEIKSAGWVAGRVSLESGGTFHAGISYRLRGN